MHESSKLEQGRFTPCLCVCRCGLELALNEKLFVFDCSYTSEHASEVHIRTPPLQRQWHSHSIYDCNVYGFIRSKATGPTTLRPTLMIKPSPHSIRTTEACGMRVGYCCIALGALARWPAAPVAFTTHKSRHVLSCSARASQNVDLT